MTYTVDLVEGLADLLTAEALGVYRPDSPLVPTETAIVLGVMPEDPDRVLCLTAYPVEDTDLTDAITAVQIRIRAGPDPRAADRLADQLFGLLHERRSYRLRGVYVALSWRESQAWIGQDVHGRMELTANYYLRTTRPGPFLNE
ncbi:minor capsid protein [Streptomyces sp. AM 2-1-1]|uniref:minor capsid protein n=1 Tax=Streptomyces sp. AM 2-1-1 TaxID=3028709 RepID=UPI0023B8ABAD|nr:minor capsid protein [Streptomyces sp. AM 2-1-1]WEH40800.1 minor capsid protein [Streptomyces sp. AM 2-1-1]